MHTGAVETRLVRGRRDRCPWDARAFLVREAHETNGRRASPDHAFPREKKLRCVYPLDFAFALVSLPTHAGGKSIFTLTMRINFSRIIPPSFARREPRFFFSFLTAAASTLDLFPFQF